MYLCRLFYDTNEEKYKVLPEYVQVGLPCASRFEDSKLWHRAKVMKIVDDLNVQVNSLFKIHEVEIAI